MTKGFAMPVIDYASLRGRDYSPREVRTEARWCRWREDSAYARAEMAVARKRESKMVHPSDAIIADRRRAERAYTLVKVRFALLIAGHVLAFPFGPLIDLYDRWMSEPDLQRRS